MVTRLYVQLSALRREERGATAVEYGMLVALIAAVVVTVVAVLGGQVGDSFTKIKDAIAA